MEDQNKGQDNRKKSDGFITWILVSSLCLSVIPPIIGWRLVMKKGGLNFQDLGPFGDFFAGSTVPILTLVGSIGLIMTLRMQKQQLDMQRQDAEETKREIREQGRTMALQRFESTFFNMITLHNEIIKSLSLEEPDSGTTHTEREVFITVYRRFVDSYRASLPIGNFHQKPYITQLRETYHFIYRNLEHKVGHYYSHLYRILKLIDQADITVEEKKGYADILKAQLTGFELTLLLYYGLSTRGIEIFPLLQKYDLLSGLIKEQLISEKQDLDLYHNHSEDTSQNTPGQAIS